MLTGADMIPRLSKIVLLAAVTFFFLLVFLNNGVLDYRGNYEFVRHVLSMDTTGEHGQLWRAIRPSGPDAANHWIYHAFYWTIIACEVTTGVLCGWGTWKLWRARHASAEVFNAAKDVAICGLTLSLLQWFTISLTIGAEWFLMFLSREWDAQGSAFRMFGCLGIILIHLNQENRDLPAKTATKAA